MNAYKIENNDVMWRLLLLYLDIYTQTYPSAAILDDRFYCYFRKWLHYTYNVQNNILKDQLFEFSSLEDLTEFKLKCM